MLDINKIYCMNCLEGLKQLPDNSVDSIVTDPPAGISFMGKSWDNFTGKKKIYDSEYNRKITKDKYSGKYPFSSSSGINTEKQRNNFIDFITNVFTEALRVLKSGGHGFVWALPRTSHWTAFALENAGFEIRDCVYHVFGSGFPKSLDISKVIDKQAGIEREIVGEREPFGRENRKSPLGFDTENYVGGDTKTKSIQKGTITMTEPATPEAKQWQGWGTALKPAVECWWLIRKPLSEKTIAENVLKWGVGGLNIDDCRIGIKGGTEKSSKPQGKGYGIYGQGLHGKCDIKDIDKGRFPSHLIHDGSDEVLAEFAKAGDVLGSHNQKFEGNAQSIFRMSGNQIGFNVGYDDSGTPARFFYCAKASKSERDMCMENAEYKQKWLDGGGGTAISDRENVRAKNIHPTVKPIALMEYLIKLITPKEGIVLDMFAGSGSTLIAAKYNGFKFIGFEISPEYCEIANKRLSQEVLAP